MTDTSSATPTMKPTRGVLGAVRDLFSSVWFGIILMVLIFLYMTVASAGLVYPTGLNIFASENWSYILLRKHPWIDKTEMEVFAWWPFTTLIGLFVVNMVVVTVRRIRLDVLNLGVWAIHSGIVILCVGSVYYFRTKLEGDTPVFRRHIVLEVPGAEKPQRFVVRPDNRVVVEGADGPYEFHIQSINPAWPLLSAEDEGKTACSVNVAVTTPTRSFVRQMLINYPQYTEDIIPGKGRAIKTVGRKLLDEDLRMTFAYEPQDYFYLMDSAALYVRELGTDRWIERPIKGLPHYSDHIASRDEIWQPAGDPVIEPDPLNIRVERVSPDDPLGDMDVRITGRLHYSTHHESRWIGGGSRFNPFVNVRLEHRGQVENIQLLALDPSANTDSGGLLTFRWANSPEEVESHAAQVGGRLDVTIPEADVSTSLALDETNTLARNPDLGFSPLGESNWSYRVRGVTHDLTVGGITTNVAIVEFNSDDKHLTRWIADVPGRTRDVTGEHKMGEPDPAIITSFHAGPAVVLIAGPDPADLHAVVNMPDRRAHLGVGEPLDLGADMTLTVTEMHRHARLARRPVVVPRLLRNPSAGAALSRIKLALASGDWSNVRWLGYHRYPLRNEQYAVPRRFNYQPAVYALPNGKQVEIIFSRKRWPLPAAVALEEFELKTHTGGFVPGQTTSVRDFISVLRTYRNGRWSAPLTCSLNKPCADGGMYYYQAEWDPDQMAFTGLGVGNRNGVYIQLLGTCLAVAGMIYVFYIKPIIKRRRRGAVHAALAARESGTPVTEPVGV